MFNHLRILIFLLFSTLIHSQNGEGNLIFSHEHGFYENPFTLEIYSTLENSEIRYTLNGSDPRNGEQIFKGDYQVEIIVDPTFTTFRDYAPGVIIRAGLFHADTLVGDVITKTYLFINKIREMSRDNVLPGPDWLSASGIYDINYGLDPEIYNDPQFSDQLEEGLLSIPTISMATDLSNLFDPDSGLYTNPLYHGDEWERETSLELLNPNGSEGFQVNCGFRIRGGWSRHEDNPKHAFRFIFRKKYGAGKLEYPLFGDEGVDEFDNIDLRTSQNYSWSYNGDNRNTFLREVFSRDTQRDMKQPYTRSRYYHLYINGTYWGLYQTQERAEASFAESYFGGDKDDYDVIKVEMGEYFEKYSIEATDGTLDKWRELWNITQSGIDDETYFRLQGMNLDETVNPNFEKYLDVDNLIDYMLLTFYAGDFDGPVSAFINNSKPNNFYIIYNRTNPDGFKFFRHDAEHTLLDNPLGYDRTGPFQAGSQFQYSNPQWIHQKLSENSNYRLRFADRVYKHLYNDGALTLSKNIERILKRKSEIETAIVAESARWGDSKRETPFTKNDWSEAVDWIIDNFFPTRKVHLLYQLINKKLHIEGLPPQFNTEGGIVTKGIKIELSSSQGEIYFTTDGTDPMLESSNTGELISKILIESSADKKVLVPTASLNDEWRRSLTYNDDSWPLCKGLPGGIGYDIENSYDSEITLDLENYMYETSVNPNTSCFVRIPFSVNTSDLNQFNSMKMEIMYDDGFIAYLNGTQILKVNAPDAPDWNSSSIEYRETSGFESFDISQYLSLLNDGKNLLAIQGLNYSHQSSDFLILPKLIAYNNSNYGSPSPSSQIYTSPIEIQYTTTIKTRYLEDSNWSALNEAKFIIEEDLASFKITELHYHPLDEIIEQDTVNDTELEFLELKNVGNTVLDLTGAYFSDGISYDFPVKTLDPMEFVILSSNSVEFNKRYGFMPFDEYEGQLNNGGEVITLLNAAGTEIFSFEYDDSDPWPQEPDGDGYSLVSVRRNPIGDPAQVSYWTVSGNINGSPNEDDIVSDVSDQSTEIINNYHLSQNYPNPFNPSTTIKYSIPLYEKGQTSNVKLNIYDILGRIVVTLVNQNQKPGNYEITWNGLSATGRQIPSGVYFYRLTVGKFTQVKKMLLLR